MDPVGWLLEPSDPSVRFWALQDIEGRRRDDPDVLDVPELHHRPLRCFPKELLHGRGDAPSHLNGPAAEEEPRATGNHRPGGGEYPRERRLSVPPQPRRDAEGQGGLEALRLPLFYQSDALEVLDTLTRLGVHDERMQPVVDLVLSARQPDGSWLLENTYNGKMWVDIEEKGRPSKWVTLRALRAFRRFGLEASGSQRAD